MLIISQNKEKMTNQINVWFETKQKSESRCNGGIWHTEKKVVGYELYNNKMVYASYLKVESVYKVLQLLAEAEEKGMKTFKFPYESEIASM